MGTPLTHAAAAKKADPKEKVSYYKQIRPIFVANCQGCHQPAKAKGGYVMTEFKQMLAGGDSKDAAIVAKQPDKSALVKLITPVNGEAEMPQGKKPLAETEIELVRRWVAQGAVDDTPANAQERYDMNHPPEYTLPPVITSIDYSPDGKLLAVAGFHEVLLHNADGSGLVARLVGLAERIESVRFSPDGKKLAVTGGLPGRMGEVQVWDVEKKKLLLSHPVTFDTVYGASWSPDGKLIAFGCGDNTVRAIEADSAKQVLFMGSHSDWVHDTVFSVKGDHVISVGRDMTAKVTELATQRFIDNITSITPGALRGGMQTVARHPERDEIAVGGADGLPQVYRVFRQTKRVIGDNSNLIRRFPAMEGRIFSIAYSRDGKRIVASSSLDGHGEVHIFNAEFDTTLPTEIAKIFEKVASTRNAEENAKVEKYTTDGATRLAAMSVKDAGIYAVTFSPDGKTVAAAGSDGKIRLIDATNASLLKEFLPVTIVRAKDLASGRFKETTTAASTTEGEPESLPEGTKVVALTADPTELQIGKWTDSAQILVTAKLSNGDAVEVTRLANLKSSSRSLEVTPQGVLRAKSNGSYKVRASLGGKSVSVPVKVTGISKEGEVDFIRDVNPVLSKLGCNMGTCHGAKEGKNGFKLSLRGYDPIYDVRAFTDDLASRRVNLASPDDSLMLLKPTGAVPHVGGALMQPGDKNYQVLRAWIAGGAKLNLDTPRVAKIEVFPKDPVVQAIGSRQQMRVVATYSDGKTRDVTTKAFIDSGNMDVAKADPTGLVTVLRRGEAPVLARFEGAYAATTVTVMGDRSGFVWQEPPVYNKIDEFAAAKWKRMKIQPSGVCTDEEFIRRIYLDLTGLPPTAEDVRKFLADKRETRAKREELVDKLIGNEDFIDHWANKWADLLQVNRKFLGEEGAPLFRKWIRDQVAKNTPYDQFVREILTASGSNKENPPASYYKILRTPTEIMENTTHLFLATRFNCNKCHDHPFERWTQDQYYQTAAYFAQVGLKKDPASADKQIGGTAVEGGKPLYEIVYDLDKGEIKHDRTGKETTPTFPFPAAVDTGEKASRREQLAEWITAKDNRYFALSFANRIWGYLTGVGLIEPLDDIRAGNPPSNPEMLNWLTQEFINSGFDARHLMRTICKSRTYQLSYKPNEWNADDKINFSHALPRRLPAEVLYDAVYRVTGAKTKIPGVAAGTRAAQLPDAGFKLDDGFFANLGKPPRESACECERVNDIQLGPVLALVSGATVSDAISDPENAIAKLVGAESSNEKLINELFLRILNRPAKKEEIQASLKALGRIDDDHAKLVAEHNSYEKHITPIMAKKDQERLAELEESKQDLAAYEKEIAPREAELDKKREETIAAKDKAVKEYEAKLPEKLAEWEKKQTNQVEWVALDPATLKASAATKLTKEDDKSIYSTGKAVRSVYTITADTDLKGITAVRLEAIADKRSPKSGPGRASDGNFVLNEIEVLAAPKGKSSEIKKVEFKTALADFSQDNFDVKLAIDGKDVQRGWAVSPSFGVTHWATFEAKQPFGHEGGSTLTFNLKQQFNGGNKSAYLLGRFRLSVAVAKQPVGLSLAEEYAAILAVAPDQRTKEQTEALEKYYKAVDAELLKRNRELADAKKPRPIDPGLKERRDRVARLSEPLPMDPKLKQLKRDLELSKGQLDKQRLVGAQDITWALINNPAFLFNH
ncbi:MAG: DUF1549 domain-containing protein [Verrucomicrobiota bacterium]